MPNKLTQCAQKALTKVKDLCDKVAEVKIDYTGDNTYGTSADGRRLIVVYENSSSKIKTAITVGDDPYQVSKGVEAGTELNLVVLKPEVTGTYTVSYTESQKQSTITVPGDREVTEIPIVKNTFAKKATGNHSITDIKVLPINIICINREKEPQTFEKIKSIQFTLAPRIGEPFEAHHVLFITEHGYAVASVESKDAPFGENTIVMNESSSNAETGLKPTILSNLAKRSIDTKIGEVVAKDEYKGVDAEQMEKMKNIKSQHDIKCTIAEEARGFRANKVVMGDSVTHSERDKEVVADAKDKKAAKKAELIEKMMDKNDKLTWDEAERRVSKLYGE